MQCPQLNVIVLQGAGENLPWDGDGDIAVYVDDPHSAEKWWKLVHFLNVTLPREGAKRGMHYVVYKGDPEKGFGGFFHYSKKNFNGLDLGATRGSNPPEQWAMFRGRRVRMYSHAAEYMYR